MKYNDEKVYTSINARVFEFYICHLFDKNVLSHKTNYNKNKLYNIMNWSK